MGLGILESKSLKHVPGTVENFESFENRAPNFQKATGSDLKYYETASGSILLIPQPSDDPNDPLNWPLWKRDLILLVLSVTSIFATSLVPILSANTLTLSLYFKVKFTDVALLTGWNLFGIGVAGIICASSPRIWGKRHMILIGTVIVLISSIWGGLARSYNSMLAARIVQGFGTAPFEALINAIIGDLFYVHERGQRMALANLTVFGGSFFTPILVGKITHTIGWPWTFYFVAIFTAICLPLVFLFCPETAYKRSASLNIDLVSKTEDLNTTNISPAPADIPKRSFIQQLSIFNGRLSDESFFKLFLRPFPLFFQPAVMWACLIQSTMIGWTVFIGVILAAIFLGPPYFWNEVKTGYAYSGAFLGAIVGFIVAGSLADSSAKWMTRKNKGIYEPEFRILLVIPQLTLGCTGLYLFGISATNLSNYSYYIPIIAFGFEVAGMVIGTVAASLYIVDAHRDIAIEAFTCLLMFKNFFSFGLTFSAYDWILQAGTHKVFMWVSSIQIVICLLSVPMYVFGKRNRSFFHRHNILEIFGLS